MHEGTKYMRCLELFRKIHLFCENECNQMLAEYDLTYAQLQLLDFLFLQNEQGMPVNQRRIEEMLGLKNPTVTGLINRLETKGFLLRVADVQDRRANIILLTDKAHRLRDEMEEVAGSMEEGLLRGFGTEEKRELERLLKKIYQNVVQKSWRFLSD